MISEGWSWTDLQDLTFRQMDAFLNTMIARKEKIARAMRRKQ